MTTTDFGSLLNTVTVLAVPCPRGHETEVMRVYEHAATWSCGAVTWLPEIPGLRHGRCPVCGRMTALRTDGRVRAHGRRGDGCDGSGRKPRVMT
ncbi:hypothetical protein F9C11_20405 [Amycolatopsis sp. VS8301801F10]|uniref:hypothetical protein n=1 Tax=unclassified Amycolatopsis TaxID=2618356 RepID=UPI0038FD083F